MKRCDKCGATTFKVGETRTDTIYQCFSRHTIYVPKGKRVAVRPGSPPNSAA